MSVYDIYRYLLFGVYVYAALVFVALFFFTAPYGRHFRAGWGLNLPATAGWVIMESPAVFVILLWFLAGIESKGFDVVSVVFIVMWEAHYIQRTFIYPFQMKGGDKRFPLLLVVMAMIFNTANGYVNGAWLFNLTSQYPVSWLTDPRFITGAAFFIIGYKVNRKADKTLRKMRQSNSDGYSIPHGGLFDKITCPNYAGEILQWAGWAIATWSLAGLGFAVFSLANLLPRARAHHNWYHAQFPDYPQTRKCLIPFLY